MTYYTNITMHYILIINHYTTITIHYPLLVTPYTIITIHSTEFVTHYTSHLVKCGASTMENGFKVIVLDSEGLDS